MQHPTRLGKYVISEVLGEGAMGVVYKGFDPDIQRVVAIKTIRQSLADDIDGVSGLAARFRNEAQAAGRLSHPGIVGVFDFGKDQDTAYIAMEFVEGRSLANYLAAKLRFTDDDIPGLMSQLLDALAHAHEQGVWHRDIKPGNIILARNGRLKIADFGIARIASAGLTQVHTSIGTPAYMAPEQFVGAAIDHRVDIYSAGVLLYLLLAGQPPFSGTPEALMYKAVHEQPVLPSKLDGATRPRFYDALVAKALAKDPAQRYASAAEFKQAIEQAVVDPIDTALWERTLLSVPMTALSPMRLRDGGALGSRAPAASLGNASALAPPPSHWDAAQLATVEQSLARHVGPLASVLVRRAARECADLPTLYAKLADQVSDQGARTAFLGHASASGTRLTSVKPGAPAGPSSFSGQSGQAAAPHDPTPHHPALTAQAQKLLAARIGPIAGVVVKKAAAKTTEREAFFQALAESVSDPAARQTLLQELHRLV